MRRLLLLAMTIFNIFGATATNYDDMWKTVRKAQDRDLPKDMMAELRKISRAALSEKEYGEYLAAELYHARVEAEVVPDSLTPAINRLKVQAVEAESKDVVLAAIYNAILGRISHLSRDEEESINGVDAAAEAYFDKALRDPDVLAATKTDAYRRLLNPGMDDAIFNNDLLSLVGHEAGRYKFLKDYYDAHGNRKAACIELRNMIEHAKYADDDMSVTRRKNMLNAAMEEYKDLPEAALFALDYYKLISEDSDVSEESRYNYLSAAIEKYSKDSVRIYCNALRNTLASDNRPSFSVAVNNEIVLTNIKNVKELNIKFTQIDTDGTKQYRVYESDVRKKLLGMATGYTQNVKRTYDRPVWQSHNDTLPLPKMPYGVYYVESSIGSETSTCLFYYTGMSVMLMPMGKSVKDNKVRVIVVSKTTGAPIANARVLITLDDYYTEKVKEKVTLMTDENGEAIFDGSFDANHIWVYASVKDGCKYDDKAFVKTSFAAYFREYQSIEERTIATMLTDRGIYRPGHTVKGSITLHNAADTDDIHVVAGKTITLNLYDPDNKKIESKDVTTNELGTAGFEFVLPADGKNGSYEISCNTYGIISGHMIFRVEEYKRPTFEVNVVDKDKYNNTIKVDDSKGAKTIDVRFKANTYSLIPVQNAEVTYSIKREKRFVYRWWWEPTNVEKRTIVESATTTTDEDGIINIPMLASIPEKDKGTFIFTINVKVTDKSGETHEQVQRIAVSRVDAAEENTAEVHKPDFEVSAGSFPRDNGNLTFTMRNSKPGKTYAFYTIFRGEEVIENGHLTFDSEYKRDFVYKPEYGEAITIAYAWYMDGKEHAYSKSILKPQPELTLPVKWLTFRDRTQPGSQETWTMKIGDGADKSKAALTATVFDKSLDAINPLRWYINVIRNSYSNTASWKMLSNNTASSYVSIMPDYLDSKYKYYFAKFDEEQLPYRTYYSRYLGGRAKGAKFAVMEATLDAAMPVLEKSRINSFDVKGNDDVDAEEVAEVPETPADLSGIVRTDLVESAFFTPSIISDEEGNITLSFTMPETMTTWRILGFVHDENMRYELIDTTCVAQKDIIVKPNVPRFLREKDNAVFAATVSNTTGKGMESDVVMQLLIPGTNTVVWEKKQHVRIEGGKTVDVAFSAPTVHNDSLLIYRIAATTADGASDGEQHYIPVLPATELVSTTFAFTQHQMGKLTRDISDLFFDGSVDRQLMIKYAPYAVQMIIDAIPSASHPEREDAMSLASATYVSTLFNNDDALRHDVTKRLKKLQLGNGAWSWWSNMRPSAWTTLYVARLLARLEYQGAGNKETESMLTMSLPYLMDNLKDEADALRVLKKKYPEKKLHPSDFCTDILYVFALSKHTGNAKAVSLLDKRKKDVNFLLDLMEKVPAEMTIYGKAHAAALLAYYGRLKKAAEHLESMKQYSVCTEEAGRYYDAPKAYYSWRNYKIPTEVAAIEALRIVSPQDTVTIEEMKRWLLHEKRTQKWDSSINTADAVFAFMLDNGEAAMLLNGTAPEDTNVIMLDGNEMPNDTLVNITEAKEFSVEKTTPGTSWGAVLVNQRAPLSSLKTRGTGFSIKREIISTEETLTVGSRVRVRITIDADRDYDFVEVCDRRAACLEPVEQLSGYCSAVTGGTARGSYSGYYRVTHDNNTEYFFDTLAKGTHVIETDYYVDRVGDYQQGTCTVTCTYAPEYGALYAPETIKTK